MAHLSRWCLAGSPASHENAPPYGARFHVHLHLLPSRTLPTCPLGHVGIPFEHQSMPAGHVLVFEWRRHTPNMDMRCFGCPLLFSMSHFFYYPPLFSFLSCTITILGKFPL